VPAYFAADAGLLEDVTLRAAREEEKLSQEDLAERADFTVRTSVKSSAASGIYRLITSSI
jgi:ribosome-binding protein aMBF1 (putative translation factor)